LKRNQLKPLRPFDEPNAVSAFTYNADTKELTAEPRSAMKVTVVSDQ